MVRKNIIAIHRWPDKFADYDGFIDSDKYRVSYLVNSSGKKGINPESNLTGQVFELDDLTQIDTLLQCSRKIIEEFGPINKIIALSEKDLTQAAVLRTELSVPGMQKNQVQFFRDKVAMKRKVKKGNLRVPEFVDCKNSLNTLAFVEKIGYPVILKPKDSSGSQGVHLIHNDEQLRITLQIINISNYECEEYISGSIFHIDGLVHAKEIIFSTVSKYLNTCLDYNNGKPLGSVAIDDRFLKNKLLHFAHRVLTVLELDNSAFHLEIILQDEREPVFLEIAARVGGGGTPILINDLYGINLVQEWIKMEIEEFCGLNPINKLILGGDLLIPEPRETPCKVIQCKQLKGTIATLYKEILPESGEILDGNGGYNHISGTFFYKGNSSKEIEADMEKTISSFEIKYEKLEKFKTLVHS